MKQNFGLTFEKINQKLGLSYNINEEGEKVYNVNFNNL